MKPTIDLSVQVKDSIAVDTNMTPHVAVFF
jgi:hypothetical protein